MHRILHISIQIIQMLHCPLHFGKYFIIHSMCMIYFSCSLYYQCYFIKFVSISYNIFSTDQKFKHFNFHNYCHFIIIRLVKIKYKKVQCKSKKNFISKSFELVLFSVLCNSKRLNFNAIGVLKISFKREHQFIIFHRLIIRIKKHF